MVLAVRYSAVRRGVEALWLSRGRSLAVVRWNSKHTIVLGLIVFSRALAQINNTVYIRTVQYSTVPVGFSCINSIIVQVDYNTV